MQPCVRGARLDAGSSFTSASLYQQQLASFVEYRMDEVFSNAVQIFQCGIPLPISNCPSEFCVASTNAPGDKFPGSLLLPFISSL
eukprot:c29385_g1_i1 orf=506-760(-)